MRITILPRPGWGQMTMPPAWLSCWKWPNSSKGQSTPYTIRFIAFGAEESGLLGSYAYLNQMTQDEFENIIVMIDLDSLVAGDIAYVYSDEGQQSASP